LEANDLLRKFQKMHVLLGIQFKWLAQYLSKILFDVFSTVKQANASIILYGRVAQIKKKNV